MDQTTSVGVVQAPDATRSADQKAAPDAAQVRLLAAQFESILLSQMLRDMRSSTFDDDPGTGFGGGPLGEALFSELSLALSRAGGIGLGRSLLDPLTRETEAPAVDASAIAASLSAARPSLSLSPETPSLPLSRGAAGLPIAAALAAGSPGSLTGIAAPALGSISALQGRVTSAYGWREDPLDGTRKFHKGADIAMPEGQDVPSARAGRVTFAGERGGYGLLVEVDHGDGVVTRYAHLSELSVRTGDQVAAGQLVGKAGSTGRATGPHLHFEVHEDGKTIDPSGFMSPEEPRS